MKQIECEIRSFITEEQYNNLLSKLKEMAEFHGEDNQITYYFDSKEDLRIQLNDSYSKIWLKEGALHDEHREEVEIRCAKDDFEKLEKLFILLGYNIEIKWIRQRNSFTFRDIDIALDHTKEYGYIIELEKIINDESKEKETVEYLKLVLTELGVALTAKEVFAERYDHYKDNWQSLIVDR